MKALSRAQLKAALVARRPGDHKGVFGHVLVVGASRGMLGAAVLAARAALRSGTGLVTLAVPAGLQAQAAPKLLEALTLGLPENASGTLTPRAVSVLQARHKERRFTVLALGPGLSRHPDAARFAVKALEGLAIPAVVDADALNALAERRLAANRRLLARRGAPCVFTPHPGEMARCLGVAAAAVQTRREASARRLADRWGGVVLLKGRRSVIASRARLVVNHSGGPGLAKGGSGDVLTGLIAGLWAQRLASGRGQGEPAFFSAALGAYLHGMAGEIAQRQKTPLAVMAGDVIEALPAAFKRLISAR